MSDVVLTERKGHLLIIRLNRPEARNAVNGELAQGVSTRGALAWVARMAS